MVDYEDEGLMTGGVLVKQRVVDELGRSAEWRLWQTLFAVMDDDAVAVLRANSF
jgi:hypothetical protein